MSRRTFRNAPSRQGACLHGRRRKRGQEAYPRSPISTGEGCDDSCPDAATFHCLIRGISPYLALRYFAAGAPRMPSACCRTWVGNRATRHRRRRLRHHRACTPDEYAGGAERAVQPPPRQTASSPARASRAPANRGAPSPNSSATSHASPPARSLDSRKGPRRWGRSSCWQGGRSWSAAPY
jgi:hypothetical protein